MQNELKLATLWFNGIPVEPEDMRRTIQANKTNIVLMQLKKIIRMKLQEIQTQEVSFDTYQNPNWSLTQADYAGQKRTLKLIDNLLDFVKE